MFRPLALPLRLFRIARILAKYDALAVLEEARVFPALLKSARVFSRPFSARGLAGQRPGQKLARALTELGPSFIKLGQFAATRADLVGETVAADLAELQDRLAPFPGEEARAIVERELEQPLEALYASFETQPVSAASIAQVHFAVTHPDPAQEDSEGREVAVKVLRPGIEAAFERDLELFRWIAGLAERSAPKARRLRPRAVVEVFAESVRIEMDLRMEAAAAAELARNFAGDESYRVPEIDWSRTSRRVLTTTRLSGIRLDDRAALLAARHDLTEVLSKAAAIFFNQVFRDGYFHGDQHPGNMFVTEDGAIGAVDFGIMGRLDRKTRTYLADMLLATLAQDYRRLAQVHVDAGWLPPGQHVETFAQALRAVCEPIFGQPLERISFARLLGQLLALTEDFEMPVQPQLVLMQKNMLMAEGVSRKLEPSLNIWVLAEPLIVAWMRENRGVRAQTSEALDSLRETAARLPQALRALEDLSGAVDARGIKLHPDTVAAFRGRRGAAALLPWLATGLSILALILALIALD
ncbi:MAG: 2-polyprenylphenol 6-hydroxylase [Rhodovibrionaceae bacterium]